MSYSCGMTHKGMFSFFVLEFATLDVVAVAVEVELKIAIDVDVVR